MVFLRIYKQFANFKSRSIPIKYPPIPARFHLLWYLPWYLPADKDRTGCGQRINSLKTGVTVTLHQAYGSKAARDSDRTGWVIRVAVGGNYQWAETYKNMNLIVVISGMNELAYRNGLGLPS